MERCNKCDGRGEVNWGEVPSMGGVGGFVMETRPCANCAGTGVYVACRECFGCGEVAMEQLPDGTWNLDGAYGPCACMAGAEVVAARLIQVAVEIVREHQVAAQAA
jgi:RecJ-like exonuclease